MKQANSNDTYNEHHNDSINSIIDKNEEFNNILKSFQEEFKITNKLIYNIHNSFSQFNEKFNALIDILQIVYNKSIKNFDSNNYDTNDNENGNGTTANNKININELNSSFQYFNCVLFNKNDLQNNGSFKFLKTDSKYILKPIKNINSLEISDFIGIDDIIKEVFKNTFKFASGKPANNVLLWGDRGTGKSSLIRAITKSFGNEPYINKIKFIEVIEDTAELIYELITIIKDEPYRFILFFDDIAFDADSLFYKKLKSILDGGLDELPENVIIYATSNKKHLTTEKFASLNNLENFIHPEQEYEEGLSLSDRFGLSFGLYSFNQETYIQIVEMYLKKYNLGISSFNLNQVRKEAVNFATIKGSRSGRTAKQFVISLLKDN
ncbi:MAG: ATP-binding protein [Deltaproteobacteria bacterium]|nr:ATP-binding protein [Deltaproteobacteria bacterium]